MSNLNAESVATYNVTILFKVPARSAEEAFSKAEEYLDRRVHLWHHEVLAALLIDGPECIAGDFPHVHKDGPEGCLYDAHIDGFDLPGADLPKLDAPDGPLRQIDRPGRTRIDGTGADNPSYGN